MKRNTGIQVFKKSILVASLVILAQTTGLAQQTIFNVPTGDIVSQGQIFGQQQVDLSDKVQSQTTLDYGLGKGWEAGLNLIDLEVGKMRQTEEDPKNPSLPAALTANVQKSWDLLPDNLLFSLGTQQGVALGDKAMGRHTSFNWGLIELTSEAIHGVELVAGTYLGHWNMVGNGDKLHAMAGLEWEVLKPIHISAEWMGGDNQIGGTTLGLTFFALPKLPLAVGYRIPNTGRGQELITFQLSFHP